MKYSKVLVIDDSSTFLKLIKDVLSKEGVNVLLADNISQGLDIIKTEKPKLILLDLIFKEEHGFGLLRTLKKDKILDSTNVIVLSAQNENTVIAKAMKLGASDYLTKPINIQALKNKCGF